MAARLRIPSVALLSVFALPFLPPAAHGDVHSERRSKSTRVSTAPDGTVTTIETEEITKDGKTTTSSHTTITRPSGVPLDSAMPAPPPPPPMEQMPSQTPTAMQAPPVSGQALVHAVLEAHNRERRQAGVPDLTWDGELYKFADEWAHHLCRSGRSLPPLQHRTVRSGSPGENLWEGATTEGGSFPIADAVKNWASERKFYDKRINDCRGGVCGHYTQLVWKTTTQVGCAMTTCAAGSFTATIWVCNYRPAGNITGERPF